MDKEKLLLIIPLTSRKSWKDDIRDRKNFVWFRDFVFLLLFASGIIGILTSDGIWQLNKIMAFSIAFSFIISGVAAGFLILELLTLVTFSPLIAITTKGVYMQRLRYFVWMRNEFYPKESIEKLVYSVRYHCVKVHLKSGKVIWAYPYTHAVAIFYKPPDWEWRPLVKDIRQAAETINVKFEVEPGKKSWEREISERNA